MKGFSHGHGAFETDFNILTLLQPLALIFFVLIIHLQNGGEVLFVELLF
jgi:hypothetical protein